MQRFAMLLGSCLVLGSCAGLGLPIDDGTNPAWVEVRLAEQDEQGDGRTAPRVIPVTSFTQSEADAMDRKAAELLQRRAELNADTAATDRPADQSETSDFVREGQDRTAPPEY